jgi:hypothetical protein
MEKIPSFPQLKAEARIQAKAGAPAVSSITPSVPQQREPAPIPVGPASGATFAEDVYENPGDVVLEYVCSKGDREHHSVRDSFAAVQAHEQHHIDEYHEMARRLGLKVTNPHISVFSEFFPELKTQVAVGGHATCSFTAVIDGEEVAVPVSRDGFITDSRIAKKLEDEKKRRAGLPPS